MRQRVVIAIALACDPRLIVADEPTTALDGAVQAQILGLLRKVVRETKTALLLVSHDLGVIASLCSRVYVMEKGQVVESGTAEEIFYSPEQEYTKQLIKNAGKMHFRTEKEKVKKEILLRTEHLTKEYHTKEGVRDLSFELYKGETFALVGESGSGKTTLARVLSGILKSDSGMIDDRSKNRAQMVFQDPYGALNPCLTVGQALEEAIRKTVPDPWLRRQKAEDILRLSGLRETVRNRYPRELSGGERQRAGIARALVCDPELLICDEAFSSLDASTRDGLLELFGTLQREQALTCLFISHDMKAVARISGRMGVLFRGELVETGRTRSVCTDPWHPYTKQLLLSMPAPDPLRAGRKKGILFREKSTELPGRDGGAHRGCPFAENCPYAMDCCREETPDSYVFGERTVKCFLYSEEHSGRRAEGYKMTSQI